MTLAILLLGLIVATCVIAYLADTLGKNLGKKRISLKIGRFSLRPRQTATLIAMASSVGVMLFTVAILMATSKSVSNALLRYDAKVREANRAREQAKAEASRAEKLSRELQYQIEDKQKKIRESDLQLSKLQQALRGTSTQLAAIRTRLRQVQRARTSAERAREVATRSERAARQSAQTALARYARAQRAFGVLKSQLQTARAQFQSAQARVAQADARLSQAGKSLQNTRGQLGNARQQLAEAQLRRAEASAQLAAAQALLATAQTSFSTAERELKTTLTQYETAANQLADLEGRSQQLQSDLEEKTAQLREVALAAQQLSSVAGRIATGDIAVSQGTVFAEKIVAAKTPSAQVRANLQSLLEEGRAALSGIKSTLTLAPLPFPVGNKIVQLEGEEIINKLAEYLSTFDAPVSVRLTAARDHAIGETEIFTRLMIIPVRRVFAEGETLASTTISANAGDARVFNQLLALLNSAESNARGKGVLPLLTTDDPYFFASGTNERIFEALHRIQSLGASSVVRLVAAQDLTTVKPVRVRFEISKQ